MRNFKFSLGEKKSIRAIILLTLVQLVIIFLLVIAINESRQINIDETKQVDITVDDIYLFRGSHRDSRWLFVADGATRYLFWGKNTSEDASTYELYDSISCGDKLSLIYYESTHIILGNINVVVDARTETEVYRTLDSYNRSKQGLIPFVIILYVIMEFIFIGIALIYVWLNLSNFKTLCERKKHQR